MRKNEEYTMNLNIQKRETEVLEIKKENLKIKEKFQTFRISEEQNLINRFLI